MPATSEPRRVGSHPGVALFLCASIWWRSTLEEVQGCSTHRRCKFGRFGERKVKVLGKCRGGSITLSVSVGMKGPLPSEWTVATPTVCSVDCVTLPGGTWEDQHDDVAETVMARVRHECLVQVYPGAVSHVTSSRLCFRWRLCSSAMGLLGRGSSQMECSVVWTLPHVLMHSVHRGLLVLMYWLTSRCCILELPATRP